MAVLSSMSRIATVTINSIRVSPGCDGRSRPGGVCATHSLMVRDQPISRGGLRTDYGFFKRAGSRAISGAQGYSSTHEFGGGLGEAGC